MLPKQNNHQDERDARGGVIKVLVVAGYGALQRAMVELIDQHPGIEVCSFMQDMRDVNRWLMGGTANVIILDWPLFDQGEVGILRGLLVTRPGVRFLAVSLYDDRFSVKQALDLGIRGYVTKTMVAETICVAICAVWAGRLFCSPDVVETLLPE
jgi:two-component system uhpT operon response regulator UhpA